MTSQTAQLTVDGQTYELPIVESTTGEKAIDIRSLLRDTGYITLDSGYMNTGSCESGITYLDGKNGILRFGEAEPVVPLHHGLARRHRSGCRADRRCRRFDEWGLFRLPERDLQCSP